MLGTLCLLALFGGILYGIRMLNNAAARKEELARLMAKVSEEAAIAEAEVEAAAAAAEYTFRPPRVYQCAVCFSPTTTRCSRCKAVRYCSGKCQIIHWRQGHKDECRLQITSMQFEEGSNFCVKAAPQRHLLDDIAHDMPGTSPSIKKMKQTTSPPQESTDLINCLDGASHASIPHKMKSSCTVEEVDVKLQLRKGKPIMSEDVQTGRQGNRDASAEMLVTDASNLRSSPSSSSATSDHVLDDREEDARLFKGKNVRSLSFSAGDHPSSTTGGHMATSSKSVLPAKISSIPSLPQSARNGLKKVVQQFRAPKQSKSNLLGFRNEGAGKYKITFPYELFMKLYCHDEVELYPFGLTNCGNSCYANAVLQCLAFTRPLTSYLVQGLHSNACRKKEWCFICEFESLILKAREGNSPLSPIRILSKIQNLGHGREEDAHEFLRYAVDTMQSVCLKEAGVVGPLAEETTLVGLTFGGYLRSKIKCMKCHGKSELYERMMDLTVEIDGDIGSLEEALAQFTGSETLDRENMYHCSRCKSYEKAKKKLTVLEAPNILTIVLKRFQSGNFGKLNKSVQFPEVLNMAPYMSGTSDKSPMYSLYAVVVHLDVMNAAFSGHYVCYVKNFQGEWFRIDDSTVIPVELERVLLEEAYMLLYARYSPRAPDSIKNNPVTHGGRSKKRNLEAVPSSLNASKTKSNSNVSSMVPAMAQNSLNASKTKSSFNVSSMFPAMAQRKHNMYPYGMTWDGPTSNQFFDPDDDRLHPMQSTRTADSLSESSSLFSCSDASSCSTTSTKDSSRSEDLSGYLFGSDWYSHYGISSDPVASSSEVENNAWQRPPQGHGWSGDWEGYGNPAILYTDSIRHGRNCSTQFVSNSSRDTDFERVAWVNPDSARSGLLLRKKKK